MARFERICSRSSGVEKTSMAAIPLMYDGVEREVEIERVKGICTSLI